MKGHLLLLYNVGRVKKMGEKLGECWVAKGVWKKKKKIKNLPLQVPPKYGSEYSVVIGIIVNN